MRNNQSVYERRWLRKRGQLYSHINVYYSWLGLEDDPSTLDRAWICFCSLILLQKVFPRIFRLFSPFVSKQNPVRFWAHNHLWTSTYSKVRVIFVWPWNKNARTKQKQQTNGNRAIWLVYRTNTNARGFWLVKRTLGWKNSMPENFLEINRYFALTSYCNTIG